MNFLKLLGFVLYFMLIHSVSDVQTLKTLKHVAVKSGASVTIPCSYDKQYKSNSKFWCQGYYWSTCTIVAYANNSGPTSVTDIPAQDIFTVNSSVFKSGYYWCAVEIGDKWTPDVREHLYLTVSSDPGLSAQPSQVSGVEGGSVKILCEYRSDYQNTQKQWCRFKDGLCFNIQQPPKDQKVNITDDGRSKLLVQMFRLQKIDAGWYYCSAGDLQAPVHLSVGQEHPGLPDNQTEVEEQFNSTMLTLTIVFILLLLLTAVGLVAWRHKQKHIGTLFTSRSQSSRPCLTSEDEITYSTLTHSPLPSALPPAQGGDEIIYSSVK